MKWPLRLEWMNQIEALNRDLFLRIYADAGAPAWLVHTATVVAEGLIYLIPLLLIAFWLQGGLARRSLALKACLVALFGVAANQAIGVLWTHPRPFMVGLGHAWIQHAADSSFPSDHMTVFAAVGLTLLFDDAAGWGAVTLLMGLGVAWSRVFLGVHFPLDMAGSLVTAGVAYAFVSPFWSKFAEACTVWIQQVYRAVLARPIAAGWLRR